MSIDEVVRLSQGFLTPVIACLALYIAWQQWKTNRRKLLWDQYDRRLRVYQEVIKILSVIQRDGVASYDALLAFRASVSEADFLFGHEIPVYVDEVYKRGVHLARWSQQYRDYTQEQPKDYDHGRVVTEMGKELEWLTQQFDPAKNRFKKYLDVNT